MDQSKTNIPHFQGWRPPKVLVCPGSLALALVLEDNRRYNLHNTSSLLDPSEVNRLHVMINFIHRMPTLPAFLLHMWSEP